MYTQVPTTKVLDENGNVVNVAYLLQKYQFHKDQMEIFAKQLSDIGAVLPDQATVITEQVPELAEAITAAMELKAVPVNEQVVEPFVAGETVTL